MSKKTGGSAFPTTPENEQRFNGTGGNGMTLRDYFAAKAMQGWSANPIPQDATIQDVAAWAYRQADAMLQEREK